MYACMCVCMFGIYVCAHACMYVCVVYRMYAVVCMQVTHTYITYIPYPYLLIAGIRRFSTNTALSAAVRQEPRSSALSRSLLVAESR